MRKRKFEYFMNAMTYSIERMLDATVSEPIHKLFLLKAKFIRLFVPKNLKGRFDARIRQAVTLNNQWRRSKSNVGAIYLFKILFVVLFIFYMIIVHKIIEALPEYNIPEKALTFIPPIIFIFIVLRAIDDDIYAVYARIFDKKDKEWHLKWRLITIVICACIFGSLFIMFKI